MNFFLLLTALGAMGIAFEIGYTLGYRSGTRNPKARRISGIVRKM